MSRRYDIRPQHCGALAPRGPKSRPQSPLQRTHSAVFVPQRIGQTAQRFHIVCSPHRNPQKLNIPPPASPPPYRTMRRNRSAGRAPFAREQDKTPAASTGCRGCRRQTFGTTATTGGLHRNRFHRAGRTPVRTGRTRTRHRRRRPGAVAPGA